LRHPVSEQGGLVFFALGWASSPAISAPAPEKLFPECVNYLTLLDRFLSDAA
jgi:hypothetical protein